MIERCFPEITTQRIRRRSLRNVEVLQKSHRGLHRRA
jgi:hypothetical protein